MKSDFRTAIRTLWMMDRQYIFDSSVDDSKEKRYAHCCVSPQVLSPDVNPIVLRDFATYNFMVMASASREEKGREDYDAELGHIPFKYYQEFVGCDPVNGIR